jgi:type III restriction enzyme
MLVELWPIDRVKPYERNPRVNDGAVDAVCKSLSEFGFRQWLRNVERKPWALENPYNDYGTIKPMFPDLIIVRKDKKGFAFDVLEPHDPSLKDNHSKAVGLAEFAEKHGNLFSRIELIRKQRDASGKERYFRLDFGKTAIRKLVVSSKDNKRLDEIFDEKAKVR